jgi:hypothetical protein
LAGLDFTPRLIQPGFRLLSQFKLSFKVVFNPLTQRFHFGSSKPGNCGLKKPNLPSLWLLIPDG